MEVRNIGINVIKHKKKDKILKILQKFIDKQELKKEMRLSKSLI